MPFLIDRRDQVLIKRIERPLKKGDIAFFQRENGQYIMHRIHFMRKDAAELVKTSSILLEMDRKT